MSASLRILLGSLLASLVLPATAAHAESSSHRGAVWFDASSDGMGLELAARPIPFLELALGSRRIDSSTSDDWLFPTEVVQVTGDNVTSTARLRLPFAGHFAFTIGAGVGHETVTVTDTRYPDRFEGLDTGSTSEPTTTVSSAQGTFVRADVAVAFEVAVFTVRLGAGMDGLDHHPFGEAALGLAIW